jgi:hypothetical protein
MALRLDQLVLRGELFNTQYFSTRIFLEVRGGEVPIMAELAGNCAEGLQGWHIQFEARPELQEKLRGENDGSPRDLSDIEWLANQQIGPTGTMTIRDVKWFDCSTEELLARCKLDEPPPFTMKKSLYLEWYSQNGRVVLELVDPIIEFIERVELQAPAPGAHLSTDPPPTEAQNAIREESAAASSDASPSDDEIPYEDSEETVSGLGITAISLDDDGNSTVDEYFYADPSKNEDLSADELSDDIMTHYDEIFGDEDDDESDDNAPYENDLDRQLAQQANDIDWNIKINSHDDDKDESLREMELMDHLIERDGGHHFGEICDLKNLTPPDELSEQEAETALKIVLGQLALSGIAIDICEHFTPKEVYRWLIDEIFSKESFHPEMRRTQWVQHFSTWESCPACDAEAERDWAKNKPSL